MDNPETLATTEVGKTNHTSFVSGNRSGHHNMELRTQRHIIAQIVGHHYTITNTSHINKI